MLLYQQKNETLETVSLVDYLNMCHIYHNMYMRAFTVAVDGVEDQYSLDSLVITFLLSNSWSFTWNKEW